MPPKKKDSPPAEKKPEEKPPAQTEGASPGKVIQVAAQAPKPAMIQMGSDGLQLASLDDLYRFSKYVSASGLAPKGMQHPESILVAVQLGLEVGLKPMQALQNIAVINGRPSIYGDAPLALVRGSNLLRFYDESATNDAAHLAFCELCESICYGQAEDERMKLGRELRIAQSGIRFDGKEEDVGYSVAVLRHGGRLRFERFTVADAKQAGLWKKSGPWTEYPQRMCKWRARAFLLRDEFGDVLGGLSIGEDIMDITDAVDVGDAHAAHAGARTSALGDRLAGDEPTIITAAEDENQDPTGRPPAAEIEPTPEPVEAEEGEQVDGVDVSPDPDAGEDPDGQEEAPPQEGKAEKAKKSDQSKLGKADPSWRPGQ